MNRIKLRKYLALFWIVIILLGFVLPTIYSLFTVTSDEISSVTSGLAIFTISTLFGMLVGFLEINHGTLDKLVKENPSDSKSQNQIQRLTTRKVALQSLTIIFFILVAIILDFNQERYSLLVYIFYLLSLIPIVFGINIYRLIYFK